MLNSDYLFLKFYADGQLIYKCFVHRMSPWFVYYHKLNYVNRFYAHGRKVRFDFPQGSAPCTALDRLHSLDYSEFIY